MDRFAFPFLWCVVQVSIVSAVALLIAAFITRRRPEAAARLIGVTSLIMWAMTLLIPVSLPGQLRQLATNNVAVRSHERPAELTDLTAIGSVSNDEPESLDASSMIQFNPASLLRRLADVKRPAIQSRLSITTVIGLVIVLGFVWGAARLLLGLVLLNSFRRRAKVISDPLFLALADELRAEMKCTEPVVLAESDEIGAAAVVGFLRSTIVFSSDWRNWEPDVRRSVLAHELAHVCRRDSLWRLIATMGQLIHFYNPLVRWLGERLILAQELAADRMAISKAGGTRAYLVSLSRLALEEDSRPRVRPHLSVTPVFSGHLIRRIEMLRAMDCKQDRSSRSWLSWTAIASIALFGLATTAMRGFAEAEPDDKPTTKSNETQTHGGTGFNLITGINGVLLFDGSGEALFQGEKVPSTHPSFTKLGGMFLNFAAFRKTNLWPIARELLSSDDFKKSPFADCNWEGLDSIASTVKLTVTPKTEKERGRVMFGGNNLRLKTNCDVDWFATIHQVFPEALDGTKDGFSFVDAQLPMLGPFLTRFVQTGPRELAIFCPHRRDLNQPKKPFDAEIDMKKWLAPNEDEKQHAWANEWDAVTGGILAVTFQVESKADDVAPDELNDETTANMFKLYRSVDVISFGIDIAKASNTLNIKVRLQCIDSADPEPMLGYVHQYLDVAKGKDFDPDKKDRDPSADLFSKLISDSYANAKLRVIRGEKNVIECETTFAFTPEYLAAIEAENSQKKVTPVSNQTSETPDTSTTVK